MATSRNIFCCLIVSAVWLGRGAHAADPAVCHAQSGVNVTPVVELFTSEGCSSCPPADRWLSSLRPGADSDPAAVVQGFHVAYWDYIGWVDRFANPLHTTWQRQIAQWNRQGSIYTPQVVLNGRDWRAWHAWGNKMPASAGPAQVSVSAGRPAADQYEAQVTVRAGGPPRWAAYWTVTEQGHTSRVHAGENAGELLKHAHLVRQFTPVGDYRSDPDKPQRLYFRALGATPGHARRVNLVVFDPIDGRTLQALSLGC